MKQKPEYALVVLRAIQPWLNKRDPLIYKKPATDNYMVQYRSVDFNQFYFTIKEPAQFNAAKVEFMISVMPYTASSTTPYIGNSDGQNMENLYNTWLKLISEYKHAINPHEEIEDKILRDSQEEIFDWFELLEEDAYTTAYDFQTQLIIDEFLEKTITLLEQHRNQHNEVQIDTLIEEATNIRSNQQHWTKGKVAESISWLVAKIKKYSLKLGWEILKELGKEAVKKIIKGEIDINGYLH